MFLHDVEGDDDGEDGVRPAGLRVHVGGRHCPGLVPLRHQVLDTLSVQDCQLGQTFHIRPQDLVFPDFQSILLATVVPVQQVKDLLIIDLHVADFHIGLTL